MKIIKEKTCAFTGHRILYNDFNKNQLKENILKVIERGYNTFLVGMALGFDTQVFIELFKLKNDYDIRIIACIPCSDQAKKFSLKDKELYYKMIEDADEKILISENYYNGCMQKRNRFMVDNSSILISYLRENKGGTYSTVSYAKTKGIEIINL